MIKGIGHNAIIVSNMEKSLDFYCNIAGLTKAFELHDQEDDPWIVYLKISKGAFLELFYNGVKDPENEYADDKIGYHHFCFEVDNIEEVAKKLFEADLMEDPKPNRGKDLNYSCWVHDPDRNAVEFVQYHPDSIHAKYTNK